MEIDLGTERGSNKFSFGDYGLRILENGVQSQSGEYFGAIQILADGAITCQNEADQGDVSITGLAISAGGIIYGNFKEVTITGGKAIGYLRAVPKP